MGCRSQAHGPADGTRSVPATSWGELTVRKRHVLLAAAVAGLAALGTLMAQQPAYPPTTYPQPPGTTYPPPTGGYPAPTGGYIPPPTGYTPPATGTGSRGAQPPGTLPAT